MKLKIKEIKEIKEVLGALLEIQRKYCLGISKVVMVQRATSLRMTVSSKS